MSINGILYYTIIQGSHNARSFLDFVDGLLDMMNPFPGPNSVVVIDNKKIHKLEGLHPLVGAR